MDLREKEDSNETLWQVPYLSIDPRDIGRTYEEIIRIKPEWQGGVVHVLSREFGLDLPKAMHPEVGLLVDEKADSESRELAADEIYATFKAEYLEKNSRWNSSLMIPARNRVRRRFPVPRRFG